MGFPLGPPFLGGCARQCPFVPPASFGLRSRAHGWAAPSAQLTDSSCKWRPAPSWFEVLVVFWGRLDQRRDRGESNQTDFFARGLNR